MKGKKEGRNDGRETGKYIRYMRLSELYTYGVYDVGTTAENR